MTLFDDNVRQVRDGSGTGLRPGTQVTTTHTHAQHVAAGARALSDCFEHPHRRTPQVAARAGISGAESIRGAHELWRGRLARAAGVRVSARHVDERFGGQDRGLGQCTMTHTSTKPWTKTLGLVAYSNVFPRAFA